VTTRASRCRARRRALAAILVLGATPAFGQAVKGSPPGPAARKAAVAEAERLAAEEARHKAEAEARALREQLQVLDQRVKQLEELSVRSKDRIERLEEQKPQLDPEMEARLKKLEETTGKLPEADTLVSAGAFPGSFRIPGTDAALKIGGQVRVTLVESFDPIGMSDRFITSSIPVEGSEVAGRGSRLTLTAIPSRFNLDFRTPTDIGDMRAFIEADFAGASRTLRLRHAFGQWGKFLFGQTWSTFADPEAEPDGIDFEGLNAISLFRQVQVRYTAPLSATLSLAASIENPEPAVTGASGISQLPDFVLRGRWDPRLTLPGFLGLRKIGHVQLAVVVRQIRAEPTPTDSVATAGFGVGLSGRLNAGWIREDDDVTFSAYWGKGIGRYITDLDSYGGQDAYYDLATGKLETLQAMAAYAGYELAWTKALRSTLTFGWVRVWNVDAQAADSLKETRRVSANVAWSPLPRLDFVTELLGGRRWDKDGNWGQAVQLQVGTRFRF
jgi:hypothetical protein